MNLKQHVMHAVSTRLAFLGVCTLLMAALGSTQVQAQITSSAYLCPGNQERHYVMNINGDYYALYFFRASSSQSAYLEDTKRGQKYDVYFSQDRQKIDPQPRNQQDVIAGHTGPGYIGENWDYRHRIVFWSNHPDYQQFDGYIMTQTKDAFAGITWRKDGVPVVFDASFHHC